MLSKIENIIQKLGEKAIENEPLSKHTVLKVGGPARIFYQAATGQDLVKAVKAAIEEKFPYLVLGMGANVLISDTGFDGLVIKNRANNISVKGKKGKIVAGLRIDEGVLVEAESGVTLVQLCRFTFDAGFSGLEFLYAIPGTVGGALKINAHGKPAAFEFIGNLVQEATLLTEKGLLKRENRQYFDFSYDYSKIIETGEVVISCAFRLKSANKDEVWARGLEYFAARKTAQPYEVPSAGCFFQNISPSAAARLGLTNGIYSTGILIAQTSLRGRQIGGAKISEKHSNFFTNVGGAKAADFIQLINLAKTKVKEKFGVDLKEEIFLIGDFKTHNLS